ncbi:MAG: LamG domain-containing protein, partial [Candidatus Nanoarchaeia archaeon]
MRIKRFSGHQHSASAETVKHLRVILAGLVLALMFVLILFNPWITGGTPTGLVVEELIVADSARVNLDAYFAEGLTYLATENDGVDVVVEGNELVVTAWENFTGTTNITVIATDGENVSSIVLPILVEVGLSALDQAALNSPAMISEDLVLSLELLGSAPALIIVSDALAFNTSLNPQYGTVSANPETNVYLMQLSEEGFIHYAQDMNIVSLSYDNGSYEAPVEEKTSTTSGFGTQEFSVSASPVVENVSLGTLSGGNSTNENLTLTFDAADADGDPIKNITNWLVDGIVFNILNMPFEGGSNSTFTRDYSLANDGNTIDAVFNVTGGYDGRGAYQFSTATSRIQGTDAQELSPNNPQTVTAWIKTIADVAFPASGWYVYTWQDSATGGVNELFNLRVQEDGAAVPGAIRAFGRTQSGESVFRDSNTLVNDSKWHYVAVVFDVPGDTISIYIDGALDQGSQTGTFGDVVDLAANFTIGNNFGGASTTAFNGTIDDFQIYNRSLTAAQVLAIFHNRTDIIVANETVVGDIWSAQVTPNDGTIDGATVQSNNVTIAQAEAVPVISNLLLNSTTGDNFTNDDLTAHVFASDLNGDPIKNVSTWIVNGTSIMLLNMPFEASSNTSESKDYAPLSKNGAVTSATFNGTGGHDGFGAYEFTATAGERITIPDEDMFDLSALDNAAFSGWFRTSDTSDQAIIAKHSCGTANGWFFSTNQGCFFSGTSNVGTSNSPGTIQDGNWHFFACVKDGNDYFEYVDGVLNESDTDATAGTVNSIDVQIGGITGGSCTNSVQFNGTLDDFVIWNRSLSVDQIIALYNNRTDLIKDNDTRLGDVWTVNVTPNDKVGDGATVTS